MKRALLAGLLLACGAPSPRGPTTRAHATTVTVPPPAPAEAHADDDPPRTLRNDPPNPRLYAYLHDGGMFMSRRMGFSKDDAYLGWAVSECDPCPVSYHFESPTKPPIDLRGRWEPKEDGQLDPKKAQALQDEANAAIERGLTELGVETAAAGRKLRGPFPYPDLVFAETSSRNDAAGSVTLHFGAEVIGEPAVFPIHIVLGPHPAGAYANMQTPVVTYANVTRDGSELGVVAMTTGLMWVEFAGMKRMPTEKFVGQVYNDTGMALHLRGKFADAAKLFAEAEDASPRESLFSYNLACAYARAGDERAKDALARAIHHGGAAVKTRAQADADFAGARDAPWFRALTR